MKISIDIETDNIFTGLDFIRIRSHGRTLENNYKDGKRPEVLEAIKCGLFALNNSFIDESVEYWEERVAQSSKEDHNKPTATTEQKEG